MLACLELDKIAIFSYVTVDTHPQLSPNHKPNYLSVALNEAKI